MASVRNINRSKKANAGASTASRSRIFGTSKSRVVDQSGIIATAGSSGAAAHSVIVNGYDVTPQSLLSRKVRIPRKKKSKGGNSSSNNAGGGGKASSSKIHSASRASFSNVSVSKLSDSASSVTEEEPNFDFGEENADEAETEKVSALEMRKKALQRMKELEDGLQTRASSAAASSTASVTDDANTTTGGSGLAQQEPQTITIQLQETDTIMLFELPSVCIALDSEQHAIVTEENLKYQKLCQSKHGSDLYVTAQAQTLNFPQKSKEVMAAPPATRDAECDVTGWDIYDSQATAAILDEDGNNDHDDAAGATPSGRIGGGTRNSVSLKAAGGDIRASTLARQVDEVVQANVSAPGCLIDVDGDIIAALQNGVTAESVNSSSMKKSDSKRHGGSGSTHSKPTNTSGGSKQNLEYGSSSFAINANASRSQVIANDNSSVASLDGGGGAQDSFDSNENDNDSPMKAAHVDVNEIIAQRQSDYILQHDSLPLNLSILERAIQQNNFHPRHLQYRNFPSGGTGDHPTTGLTSGADDSTGGTDLAKLWSFHFDLTKDRTVSSMAWNPVNQDLLAVSYGQFEFTNQKGGLVLFWSLKNPEYPERVFHLEHGVTSIDLSTAHPNLLAVGLYNGVVAIYDTRRQDDDPILQSGLQSSGTHMDAVWQVKWVDKGSERGERLVSISSDGRVTEWSMKKGLSFTDLMLFKRIASQQIQTDGVISRTASGHCIDFARSDSSVYFAGTEDGVIHKCSCSYNEQYLQSYFGHTGPVYRVRLSPFSSDLLLSCSADWTVKLWDQNEPTQPLLTFHSVDLAHAVHDVNWSPTHSTVFGSCTEDGRIEIWDLAQSTLDPIVTHSINAAAAEDGRVEATSLLFAPSAPVVAVGDSSGDVAIYRLSVLTRPMSKNPVEALKQAISTDAD